MRLLWPRQKAAVYESSRRSTLRYLFNVEVLLCARLKKVNSHLLRELLGVRRLHHLGVGVVVFVSHCELRGGKKHVTKLERTLLELTKTRAHLIFDTRRRSSD